MKIIFIIDSFLESCHFRLSGIFQKDSGQAGVTKRGLAFFPSFFILISLGLLAGCAGHYNIPMVDVTATPPDIVQKLPLNVAILIPDELENYTVDGKDNAFIGGTRTFPLGRIIKKYAFDMLSPAFNKTVVVKNKPYYSQDIDAVIIPTH